MMFNVKKITALLVLTAMFLALTVTVIPAYADMANGAAVVPYSQDQSGDVIVAVNTNIEDEILSSSYLTSNASALSSDPLYNIDSSYQTYSLTEHEVIGRAQNENLFSPNLSSTAAEYELGQFKNFKTGGKTVNNDGINADCLYIGEFCTVWGQNDCDASIKLSSAQAAEIGTQFDLIYSQTTDWLGDCIYDADYDGKVALVCYDIDDEKARGESSSYTAGFFNSADLSDQYGMIGDIVFKLPDYINCVDMLHIDTYPGMGSALDNISACYPTLTHELQHLINYSYNVIDGCDYETEPIPAFLNEAFSLTAEYIFHGENYMNGHISAFNNEAYGNTDGQPLTYMDKDMGGYSRAFMFGQYIRTRWAQKTGGDGNDFFKLVLETRRPDYEDPLQIIADLLDEPDTDSLLVNFWCALYLKEESGVYGFNGESIIDSIIVTPKQIPSSATIYNGGACFYMGNPDIILETDGDIKLYSVFLTMPEIESVSLTRTGITSASVVLTVTNFNGSATAYYNDEYLGEVQNGENTFIITVSEQDAEYGFSLSYGVFKSDESKVYLEGNPEPKLELSSLSVKRYLFFYAKVKFNATKSGKLYYTISYNAIKNKSSIKSVYNIESGNNTFTTSGSFISRTVSFYYVDENGNESDIYSYRY